MDLVDSIHLGDLSCLAIGMGKALLVNVKDNEMVFSSVLKKLELRSEPKLLERTLGSLSLVL